MVTASSIQESGSLTRMPFEERRERLEREIAAQLALGNRRLESHSDLSAVIVVGKPVNHILHLLIMVFTIGLWGLVWLILSLTGGEKRDLVRIDENGNVTIQRVS